MGFADLGLEPHLMSDEVVASMLDQVLRHRNRIVIDRILPRVRWR